MVQKFFTLLKTALIIKCLTVPPLVTATAEAATGDGTNTANYASVENAATTTTTAKGRAANAVSAGLLVGMVNTSATCEVNIIAIGI